jgi:hypothetical protein
MTASHLADETKVHANGLLHLNNQNIRPCRPLHDRAYSIGYLLSPSYSGSSLPALAGHAPLDRRAKPRSQLLQGTPPRDQMLDRMHGLHLHAVGSLHAVMPCGQ